MNIYIRILLIVGCVFSFCTTHASGVLDHFEVILGKEKASIGQALDITISAVDRNGEVVTDYTGDVLIFSESDAEAEFPNDLSENSYSFTLANEWSVKFENAVKFQNPWKQDIFVYDLNDDSVLWVAEIDIVQEEIAQNIEVLILSPEVGVTHSKNSIVVSGSSTKNHQITLILNTTEEFFTTTDTQGMFELQLDNLKDGVNSVQAMILDADNEVIGESEVVEFKVNATKPELKSIILSPNGEIEAESEISLQVVSNAWLMSVQVLIDDVISSLREEKDGIYIWTARAPAGEWTYPIDVMLKNEFALETVVREATSIDVVPLPELLAPSPEEEEEEVEQEEVVEEAPTPDLTIRNIDVVELKTKSVITWDALEDAVSYNIYKKSDDDIHLIDTVTEAKYEIEITGDEIVYEHFAIKAVGKDEVSGEELYGDISEMTKVKTGPEMYVFLAIIALLLAAGVGFMRKNA